MEIEGTPIYREVQTILANGPTTTNVTWDVLFHYGDQATYSPLSLLNINTKRDYIHNYTDETTINVLMPLGDYARIIYPNRNNLEITLTKSPLEELAESLDQNGQNTVERYTAVLISDDRSPTIAQGQEVNDLPALNLVQFVEIHFQIYDKAIEQLRVAQTGGVYRSCLLQNVVKTLLTNAAQMPKVSAERSIVGVDMVEADNQDLKGQIAIPHGTHVIDVPDFLQNRYGLYNAGVGSYIQNKNWFVYPLYDTTEFNQRHQTVTFMVLPKRKFSDIERTFELVGTSLNVLITGETRFRDDNGSNYLNAGNGARFADANTLMDDPVTTGGNRVRISRDDNNNEFVSDKAIGGIQNAVTSRNRITANPFVAWSELAAKNGGAVQLVWQNSDPTLLTPGMAAKVMYVDGEELSEIYGIVHHVHHICMRYGNHGNPRFKNQSVVILFVNGQVQPIQS